MEEEQKQEDKGHEEEKIPEIAHEEEKIPEIAPEEEKIPEIPNEEKVHEEEKLHEDEERVLDEERKVQIDTGQDEKQIHEEKPQEEEQEAHEEEQEPEQKQQMLESEAEAEPEFLEEEKTKTIGEEQSTLSNITFPETLLDESLMGKPSKPTYPPLMPKFDSRARRTRLSFSTSDRATKRVIAPYVKVIRKSQKVEKKEEREEVSREFKFYLKKKPSVLMRNLSAFLSDSVDLASILHETCEVLKNVIKAIGSTLYMADLAVGEIYQLPRNVISDRHKVNWKIEPGKTIAAYVAYTKEYVMVDEVLGDLRFPDAVPYRDETIKSVLCVPIVTPDNECFAVLEFYRDVLQPSFARDDLQVIVMVTGWMGAAIHQNTQRLALQKQQELNDYLLELTRCYLGNTLSTEKLIAEVISFAKITLGAEKGSFLIIDKQSSVLQADVYEEGFEEQEEYRLYKKNLKVILEQGYGVLGLVARTGESINIRDACEDPRFERDTEDKTGVLVRSLLCVPILSVDGILGSMQLINKKTSVIFSAADENLLKVFSMYCTLALHYNNLQILHFRTGKLNECYMDLVKFHIAPCRHEVNHFRDHPTVETPAGFDEFEWYIPPDLLHSMPQLTLTMVTKVVDIYDMDFQMWIEFILSAKKSYRNNSYHNFEHAFTVTHCMYNILIRNLTLFTPLENKALILAALCHDLDHRGFTNNFLQTTHHHLYSLYEESYLENHHFLMTMTLLGEYQVFTDMSNETFKQFSHEVKALILATDLAAHFRSRTRLIQLYHETTIDLEDEVHSRLVKDLMMTVSDLSGMCKPFDIAKAITDGLYREFYRQGDIEKSLNLYPLSMMDRDKQHLVPEDQVQFMTVVVIPCVDLLKALVPGTGALMDNAEKTRDNWREIIELRGVKCWRQGDSVVDDKFHGD